MSVPQRMRQRPTWRHAALAVGLLVVLALVAWGLSSLAATDTRNERLERDVSTLADQVRRLGGTPSVSPSPPAPGQSGRPGAPGSPGSAGRPGSPGSPGAGGSPGPPGVIGPTGPPGASVTGPAGAPGSSGQPGQAGQDGSTGQQGPAGEQGPKGEPGPQGEPGERGPAGPACPDGYHPEQVTVVTQGGPQQAVMCVRDEEP